jgi:cyclase
MLRPRIIPVLLLKNEGLYKSKQFKDYKYIGDPINAVKIFNDSKADELVFLDITATLENKLISLDFVREVGEEANMPFGVGGGIRTLDHIREIIGAGAEKVIINSYAVENPDFIRQASDTFGSSAITVCVDFKSKLLSKVQTWTKAGTVASGYSPVDFAKLMEDKGAGEIIIQSIEKDGMMAGYDLAVTKAISEAVSIPVVALGGAGNLQHLNDVYKNAYANGLAAGSIFIYKGTRNGVLINYPEKLDVNFI